MRKQLPTADERISLVAARPTADQYLHLREQADWDAVAVEAVSNGLSASLYSILAVDDNRVVGCARIIGDGGLYFYIQDMLVDREYRGQGVGTRLMSALLEWLRSHAGAGAFIGLMSAQDVAGFYESFGFVQRPKGRPGMYLPVRALQSGTISSPVK